MTLLEFKPRALRWELTALITVLVKLLLNEVLVIPNHFYYLYLDILADNLCKKRNCFKTFGAKI